MRNVEAGFSGLIWGDPSLARIESSPVLQNVQRFNSIKDFLTLRRIQDPTTFTEPLAILRSPRQGNRDYQPVWHKDTPGMLNTKRLGTERVFLLVGRDQNCDEYQTPARREAGIHFEHRVRRDSEFDAASTLTSPSPLPTYEYLSPSHLFLSVLSNPLEFELQGFLSNSYNSIVCRRVDSEFVFAICSGINRRSSDHSALSILVFPLDTFS